MGQKVHPVGIRLGITKEWSSRLYANSQVFPAYVEQDAESRRHAWVLEPKALPTILNNAKQALSAEDVKLASYHLSRFIRSGERARR